MEPTTEIVAYNSKLEADLMLAKLREAGIDGYIVADNLGGTFPMMQMTTGGYRIMVPVSQAEEATEIAGHDEEVLDPMERSDRSALLRLLVGLSPTQLVTVLALLTTSFVGIIYAVTRGTL